MKQRLFITAITASLLLTGCGAVEEKATDAVNNEATETVTEITEETSATAETSEKEDDQGSETTSEISDDKCLESDDTKGSDGKITIADIMKANSNENVLSLFDSVRTEVVAGENRCTLYADSEFKCLNDPDYADGQIGDRVCTFDRGEFETEFSEDKEPVNIYERVFSMNGSFYDLIIKDIQDDGEYSIVTAVLPEDSSETLFDIIDMDDSEYNKITAEITLHSDNLIIDKMVLNAVSSSGSEEIMTFSCSYNEEKDELMKKIYEHMNTEDLRTITMIVNPGEDDEYTLSTQGVRGDKIQIVSFYNRTIISEYEDRECTKDYNASSDNDLNADFLFYGKEWPPYMDD